MNPSGLPQERFNMFTWLKNIFFGTDISLLNKIKTQKPSHLWITAVGDSRREVFKKLEESASLPPGDLSQKHGSVRELASWPQGIKIKQWSIESRTNAVWKEINNTGYVAGDISYVDSRDSWVGRLHVSRNCPGVFGGDGRCTSCGAISEF